MLRLHSLQIENLAAFPVFSATFPAVALIQGRNGLGKSSLLAVLRYAFGRRVDGSRAVEHDPAMIHGNAEGGEATLTFDDGSQLRVRVTKAETFRMTKPKDGKKWNRAAADIDALANSLSYDPVQFRTFDEKKRVETLLSIMPATVTAEEITAAIGDVGVAQPHEPGLAAINEYYRTVYELRTRENGDRDRLTKHAEELEAALPQVSEEPGDSLESLRKLQADIDADEAKYIAACGKALDGIKAEANATHEANVTAINEDINKRIQQLEAERASRLLESNTTRNEAIDTARGEANDSVRKKRELIAPKKAALSEKIGAAEALATASAQADGTRKAAATARAEAQKHTTNSARMTAALERLNALKETVAGRLPIKGFTIASPREGAPVDVCRMEKDALIPFSKWNDTSQLIFCMKIAKLRPGHCGLICIDSIDAVDPKTRPALLKTCQKYAEEEGFQFLLGEATGDDLRVAELEG